MQMSRGVFLLAASALIACKPPAQVPSPSLDEQHASSAKDLGRDSRSTSSQSAGSVTQTPQDETAPIVNSIMEDQYGNSFDSTLQCWIHAASVAGTKLDYCMRPGRVEVVAGTTKRRLFFTAANVLDSGAAPGRFMYGHLDPGLMGAFEVDVESTGKWSLVAASPVMEFGSAGACGCQDAKFVRLGRDQYGWVFTSGGTWQGTTVLYHSIIARRGQRFEDVSRIPMIEEGAQDVEYTIAFDSSDLNMDIFPLLVTRAHADGDSTEFKVPFDASKWTYEMKGTQK